MTTKILFVDDDNNLLDAIQRALRKKFSIHCALGGEEGLRRLASDGPYAIVVADMQMPGMTGLEFLRAVRTQAPDTVRIMLTGNSDQKTAVDAVNDGHVFRFLTKPCPPPTLTPALEAGLAQHRLITAEREVLEKTLGGTVKILSEILAMADPETFERSHLLTDHVRDFMRTSNDEVPWELDLAASLSQIGRITIPHLVFEKARDGVALSAAEQGLLDQVPAFGADLLEKIPRLENVAAIVRYQHQRFDGSGGPLTGTDIPIGARILKVLGDLVDLEARGVAQGAAFAQMQARWGSYDLEVLSAVCRWCDFSLARPRKSFSNPQMRRIDQLRSGQILAQDLYLSGGPLLLPANTALTPMLLGRLLNLETLSKIDPALPVYEEPEAA